MNVQESYTLAPTNTNQQIVPQSPNELDPPFNDSATYDSTAGTMTYSCSLMLPSGISFANKNVKAYQFYTSSDSATIEVYFIYDQSGTPGDFVQQDVIVEILPTDYNGHPIPFGSVASITSLVENQDPKTSRGTVTTIRRTGGH